MIGTGSLKENKLYLIRFLNFPFVFNAVTHNVGLHETLLKQYW